MQQPLLQLLQPRGQRRSFRLMSRSARISLRHQHIIPCRNGWKLVSREGYIALGRSDHLCALQQRLLGRQLRAEDAHAARGGVLRSHRHAVLRELQLQLSNLRSGRTLRS